MSSAQGGAKGRWDKKGKVEINNKVIGAADLPKRRELIDATDVACNVDRVGSHQGTLCCESSWGLWEGDTHCPAIIQEDLPSHGVNLLECSTRTHEQ